MNGFLENIILGQLMRIKVDTIVRYYSDMFWAFVLIYRLFILASMFTRFLSEFRETNRFYQNLNIMYPPKNARIFVDRKLSSIRIQKWRVSRESIPKKYDVSDFVQTLYTRSVHQNMPTHQSSALKIMFGPLYGTFCEVLPNCFEQKVYKGFLHIYFVSVRCFSQLHDKIFSYISKPQRTGDVWDNTIDTLLMTLKHIIFSNAKDYIKIPSLQRLQTRLSLKQ